MILIDSYTYSGKTKSGKPKRVHYFFLGTDFMLGTTIQITPHMINFELGIGILHFTYTRTKTVYVD